MSGTFIFLYFSTLRVAWHLNAALLSVLYVVEWEVYIANNKRRHWLEGLGDEFPLWSVDLAVLAPAKVAWEQHTSAYVSSIRQQHTSTAYVSIRQEPTSVACRCCSAPTPAKVAYEEMSLISSF